MMKPRSSRVVGDQAASVGRNKAETLANGAGNQQTSAQAIRKRRSSINVYDQPSSLNSRLRQLETDMLRLDEDRTKLYDDTHSSLAQFELKFSEIHAILKSRQDNVEKYVEDMRLLLQAKEEFEKQTKLLNEKHDRIHEKFMHRETIISREIKLLKNKFEILEKNRQFRGMLQKSTNNIMSAATGDSNANDDLTSGLDGSANEFQARKRSETATIQTGEMDSFADNKGRLSASNAGEHGGLIGKATTKSVRINMSKLSNLGQFLGPLFGGSKRNKLLSRSGRRKSNKISSISEPLSNSTTTTTATGLAVTTDDDRQDGAPGFHLEPSSVAGDASGTGTELVTGPSEKNASGLPPPQDKRKRSTFLKRLFG